MLENMDKIVSLCKGRGFIYPGSEIYGGLANSWDYGPLGVELKNNVKKAWMKKFIQENRYNVGLDSAIIMNPETWVATGHVGGFSDPLIDCKECKTRHRADKLIEEWAHDQGKDMIADGMTEKWDEINTNSTGKEAGFYVSEWDGKRWIKRQMRNGETVVIKDYDGDHSTGEDQYKEWMLINGELVNNDARTEDLVKEEQDRAISAETALHEE